MRKFGWILLVAGTIVLISYIIADLAVKEASGSSNPSVVHEIGKTLWNWGQYIGSAAKNCFKAFFIDASVPVAVKGAGAAVMLAVAILIYTQMWSKSSRSSGGHSSRGRSRG